ncbi:hypothetical protein SODG_000309 [Sodalis praecaptivus]
MPLATPFYRRRGRLLCHWRHPFTVGADAFYATDDTLLPSARMPFMPPVTPFYRRCGRLLPPATSFTVGADAFYATGDTLLPSVWTPFCRQHIFSPTV